MSDIAQGAIPFSPRLVLHWLRDQPSARHRQVDGTLVFADLSGFTAMSERLARLGREGAEQLTDIIDTTFADLLADAYAEGGQLLSFGGDALLLLFTGEEHAARGARGAVGLRRATRAAGQQLSGVGAVRLRISIGAHSGSVHLFLVGGEHRQLIIAGAAVSDALRAEGSATSGQIALTPPLAALLPTRCQRTTSEGSLLLARAPAAAKTYGHEPPPEGSDEVAPRALAPQVREVVAQGIDQPEHRTVAIAFVQVMGTDDLIAADPEGAAEELDAVVRDVQSACDEYGACLLASDIDNDGIKLILTAGAPRSSGNDEERLLLTLRQVMDKRRTLGLRMGVHRGSVFTGQIGPSYRRTFTVMGDTVNLTARVMSHAVAGQILATHDVIDRCRTPFALTEIDPFAAKGKKHLVHAVAVGAVLDASDEQTAGDQPAFVGRRAELATLTQAWARCRERDEGSCVQIVGEPGIGKTTLLRAFVRQGGVERVLSARGDLYSVASPYRVVRGLLTQALALPASANQKEIHTRLARVIEESAGFEQVLPLIADVLGFEVEETEYTRALADEARVEATQRAVVDLLTHCLDEPTVVAIEDCHWADEASALTLDRLAKGIAASPWLVVTTRRDVAGGFVLSNERGTTLAPHPLDEAEALELARDTMAGTPLAPSVLRELSRRAAGNPLFLRELVVAVREQGSTESLPDSLDALLTARLDRLDHRDRELVCRAAVLGERFSRDELNYVVTDSVSRVAPSTLQRISGFIRPVSESRLAFSHALVRDAAYHTLPYRLRRRLHAAVAEAMTEGNSADAALLSFHFSAAGNWRQAWLTSRAAGETAADAYAPTEAATLLQRAVDAARHAEARVGVEDRVELSLDLARAYARSGDFAAADRVLRMARRDAPTRLLTARLLVEQAWLAERQGRIHLAVRRAMSAQRTLTEIAEASDEVRSWQAKAMVVEGWARDVSGQHARAARVLGRAYQLAQRGGDRRTLAHAGSILDWSLAMSGSTAEPRHVIEALEIYRELDEAPGQAICLTNLGAVAYLRGDWPESVDFYREGQQAYLRAGDETSAALGAVNIGEVLSDQGHWQPAITSLEEARSVWMATGHRHGVAYAEGLLGRALARSGRTAEALDYLGTAVAGHREVGARREANQAALWVAEAHVLMGDGGAALRQLAQLGGTDGPCALRIRATAAWLAGDAPGAVQMLEHAISSAQSASDVFEEIASIEVLHQLDAARDPARYDETLRKREKLGIVALAVLPSDQP